MTTTRSTEARPTPIPQRPPVAAPAAPAASPRLVAPPRDLLQLRSAQEAQTWQLPADLAEAGPELRRHLALKLRQDPVLIRLERQYSAGQLDDATFQAMRVECVDRAKQLVLPQLEAEAAKRAGESVPYFVARHHGALLSLYIDALGDYHGQVLQDLRWEVFARFRREADADPVVQRLIRSREERVKALAPGSEPDRDPAVGQINGELHRRENALRLLTQDEILRSLDSRLEIDAPTRKAMREFVAESGRGTLGSGVWNSVLATVIRDATHKPGELDASHTFVGVLPGLYYESVVEPPPEASGVKPTSALELFAGFHGSVRTQQITGLSQTQTDRLYDFAVHQQGIPYNRLGVALGVEGLGKSAEQDGSYYCAEFVARALTQSGVAVETVAGNTSFDVPGREPSGGLPGEAAFIRLVRAVPYTILKIVAPSAARSLNNVGLTLDDAIGSPRISPQKLVNARINGHPLTATFDATQGRER